MGGVDVADQRLGAHAHKHRPMTFFWRRVFDQEFAQAVSNGWLLFYEWAGVLVTQCTAALEAATQDGGMGDAGEAEEGGVAADSCDLTVTELREFQTLLKKAMKMERVDWDRRLANHLMSLCNAGHTENGARRATKPSESYVVNGACSSRVCHGGGCKTPPGSPYAGTRTRGACWCDICTNRLGKDRALILCTKCHKVPEAHVAAGEWAAGRKYKPISWLEATPE